MCCPRKLRPENSTLTASPEVAGKPETAPMINIEVELRRSADEAQWEATAWAEGSEFEILNGGVGSGCGKTGVCKELVKLKEVQSTKQSSAGVLTQEHKSIAPAWLGGLPASHQSWGWIEFRQMGSTRWGVSRQLQRRPESLRCVWV